MALRGENVGTAYVRILADGSQLDDDIRDSLSDTDEIFDKQGRKDTEIYSKAQRRELRKQRPTTQKALAENFRLRSRDIQDLTKEMSTNYFKNLEKEVRRGAGDSRLGEHLVTELRKSFAQGGYDAFGDNYKKLHQDLGRWEAGFARQMAADRAKRETADNRNRIARERTVNEQLLKLTQERAGRQRAARQQEMSDWDDLWKQIETEGKNRVAREDRQHRDMIASLDRLRHSYSQLSQGVRNSNDDMVTSIRRTRGHVEELRQALDTSTRVSDRDRNTYHVELDRIDNSIIRLQPRFRRLNSTLDRMAPRIGRMFGRGARNDAINLFGIFAEGASRMLFTLPRMVEGVTGFIQAFRSLPESVTGFSRLSAALGTTGASLSSLVPALGAVAIALPVIVVAVGTLVAALSLLLGIITALAGTIYFALIGSLSAVLGAVVPLAAGIGVLVGAIYSMSDAQKAALKTAINPFIEGMKEMGRSAADIIFGGEQFTQTIGHMTKALTSSNMAGLVDNIAVAIGNVGNQWAASLNSPGFQRFVDVMSRTLPGQIEGLGRVTANVFSGIGGTIIALQPTVDRFVAWLERITREWADWAQSVEGQNRMKEWFDDAVESAKSFGDFIGQLVGLMHDLFAGGQDTGDNIFDSMADSIERFREYIADGGMEKWFQDTAKFASALGSALGGVGQLLDALDSSASRFTAGAIFAQLGLVLDGISFSIEGAAAMFELLWAAITNIPEAVGWLAGAIGDLGGAIGGLIEGGLAWLGEVFSGLGEDIDGFASSIAGLAEGGLAILGDMFTSAGEAITSGFTWALERVQQVTDWLIATFEPILVPALDILGSAASIAGSFFSGGLAFGMNAVRDIGQGLADFYNNVLVPAFDWVIQKGTELANFFLGPLFAGFTLAKDLATDLGNWLKGGFSAAWDWSKDRATSLANALTGTVKSGFSSAGSGAKDLASDLRGVLGGALRWVRDRASDLGGYIAGGFRSALSGAKRVIDSIGDALGWVADRMEDAARAARDAAAAISRIRLPDLGGFSLGGTLANLWPFAEGGIVTGPTRALIGEDGPEAVIPLNRPLSQVDPAVRALSAIAQGRGMGGTNNSRSSAVTFGDINVVTPTRDPAAVAHEVMDDIVAQFI